jgi:hypothetical protein
MEKDVIKNRKDDGILNALGLPDPWCDPHKAFSLTPTSWKNIKGVAPISCLLVVDGKEVMGNFVAQTSGFRPFSLLNNALHGRRNFDHRIVFKMKEWDVCVARVPQGLKNDEMLKAFEILRSALVKILTGTKIPLEDVLLKLKELDVYSSHQPQKIDNTVASNNNNASHDARSSSENSPEEIEELKKKNKELEEKLQKALEKYPEEYLCPILCDIMKDPVILKDGHTYDRSAIEEWLSKHDTSPMTGARLISKELIPNYALKKMIATYLEESSNKNNSNNSSDSNNSNWFD